LARQSEPKIEQLKSRHAEEDMQGDIQSRSTSPVTDRTWIAVFVLSYLGLLVDGVDLIFLSFSLSTLKREFGLSNLEAGALGSITLAGMAVGGVFGGWAADRFGRVRAAVWTIVVFSVGSAALGLTHSYPQFAMVRFIASLGLGSEYVVCNMLMAEYVSTRRRTTILATLQTASSVGFVIATLLVGWILPRYGWRCLFMISIVPVGLAVLIHRIVPEPPAYLTARAKSALDRREGKKEGGPMRLTFTDAGPRRMFLLWSLTATLFQFGFFGVNNWMPTYLEQELHVSFSSMTNYMVSTYLAATAGKVIAGWLADKLGRRPMFVFGAFGTAVFLPVIVHYHTPENIAYLMTCFGFLYGIPYGVNATYMTESFETRIRGFAVGGAYNVGRIGAAMAPALIGYLTTGGSIGLGFLVMGGAYFLCGLVPALFIKDKLHDPQTC
jgi:AAHS family cis,cis-muconate transporter-like MFS transporter